MEKQKLRIIEINFIKVKSEKVLARADVHFDGFWLRGFKILRDEKTGKEYVTPPSYFAGNGWRALFRTDSKKDWKQICRHILKEFNRYQLKESANEIKEKDIPS